MRLNGVALKKIEDGVFQIISDVSGAPRESVAHSTHLIDDLRIDPIKLSLVYLKLEQFAEGWNSDRVNLKELMYAGNLVTSVQEYYRIAG